MSRQQETAFFTLTDLHLPEAWAWLLPHGLIPRSSPKFLFFSCCCGSCSQMCFIVHVCTSIKLPVSNCDKNPIVGQKQHQSHQGCKQQLGKWQLQSDGRATFSLHEIKLFKRGNVGGFCTAAGSEVWMEIEGGDRGAKEADDGTVILPGPP